MKLCRAHTLLYLWEYLINCGWFLTQRARVQSLMTLCGIRGTGAGFPPSYYGLPLPVIIPPLLRTHLSTPPEVRDSPNHAAHYHILGL
jgi:hypothetical protein